MTTLDPHSLSEFLDRFWAFNDAVIRRIQHCYIPGGTQQSSITLSTKDQDSENDWSNVTLVITGVSEILFREGVSTRQVLSDGLSLKWINGQFWCDFSPHSSDPEDEAEIRRSDFYIAGATLNWTVAPYAEEVECSTLTD
jgi:hypothetical protein